MFTAARDLSISSDRWVTLPLPPEPYMTEPGRALASATSSVMFDAGREGWAMITSGAVATLAIGLKSRGRS